jgi:hypothetical protein
LVAITVNCGFNKNVCITHELLKDYLYGN